ncbi:MAG: hypothetical protein OHK006_00770 [Thermodesulfovibrionales bacterium]
MIDPETIIAALNRDPVSRTAFEAARGTGKVYLVGGYIRDLVIGRNALDRDFITEGDPAAVSAEFSRLTGCPVVRLGDERLYRCFVDKSRTVDFTALQGDLYNDLAARDFTVNSMAWSPDNGLIDLHGGLADIEARRIRMIQESNLRDDPVRLIRAYRLSAETGFSLDGRTRSALSRNSPLIRNAKSERITLEFFKILNSDQAVSTIEMMFMDNVIGVLLGKENNEIDNICNKLLEVSSFTDGIPLNIQLEMVRYSPKPLGLKGFMYLVRILLQSEKSMLLLTRNTQKVLAGIRKAFSRKAQEKTDAIVDIFQEVDEITPFYLAAASHAEGIADYERLVAIRRSPILSTEEIQAVLGFESGREIGEAKLLLERKTFKSEVRTPEDARRELRLYYNLT